LSYPPPARLLPRERPPAALFRERPLPPLPRRSALLQLAHHEALGLERQIRRPPQPERSATLAMPPRITAVPPHFSICAL